MKLEFQNVSIAYGGQPVLTGAELTLNPGITVLLGRNGAGKSSLLRCLTGEKRDYTGHILLDGTEVRALPPRERARRMAYLPQELPQPRVTVQELVAFGRSPYLPLNGRLTETDAGAVEKALSLTDMIHLSQRLVDSLSGGERKRAFLAMVLAQETRLVVLDEPMAQLDAAARLEFCALLKNLRARTGRSFLVVMHELPEALLLAENVAVLAENKVVFAGTPEACLEENIPENYFDIRITGSRETGYAVLAK